MRRLFRLATGRSTSDEDFAAEAKLHVDLRTQELIEGGMSPAAAREAASRHFGDLERISRSCREIDQNRERSMRRTELFQELRHDVRFAYRTLVRSPAFTVVAILTLALGIGATAAMFTVVNGVLLRPLPYPNAPGLVLVWTTPKSSPGVEWPFAAGNFLDLRNESRVLEHVSAFRARSFILTSDGNSELLEGARVTAGFFEALGMQPLLGRTIATEDDRAGAPHVVLLGYGLWQRRFGGDPNILGQLVALNDSSYQVVGVMPKGFAFPRGAELPSGLGFPGRSELWIPMAFLPADAENRGSQNLAVVGLLKSGRTVEDARADIALFWRGLIQRVPPLAEVLSPLVVALQDDATHGIRRSLIVLLGAVAFLLLIACANVSNLLLTRSTARHREVAIRVALGAGNRRLARQFLVENLLLALAGGACGVLLAVAGKGALFGMLPGHLPRVDDITVDWSVLALMLGIVIVAGIAFGITTAAHMTRSDHSEVLRGTGKSSVGRAHRRTRQGLIVAEVALSFILLAGAAALGRSFIVLQRVQSGMDSQGVFTAQLILPLTETFDPARDPPRWARFFREITDRLATRPGVIAAGAVTALPLSGAWESTGFSIEGRPAAEPGQTPIAQYAGVSDGYFRALRIPLRSGRFFGAEERRDSATSMIISESMAARYFPGENPIGRRIKAFFPFALEIVGVVGDVRQTTLDSPIVPSIYFPLAEYPAPNMSIVVRSQQDARALESLLREVLKEVDPGIPLSRPETMLDVLAGSLAQQRFSLILLAFFACAALGLATVGIYGVIANVVSGRTRELGIRLALGAEPKAVRLLVLRDGLVLSGLGVVIGGLGAMALGRVLASLVYAVNPVDPLALACVAVLLLGVGTAASILPALRAMRIDPIAALRAE